MINSSVPGYRRSRRKQPAAPGTSIEQPETRARSATTSAVGGGKLSYLAVPKVCTDVRPAIIHDARFYFVAVLTLLVFLYTRSCNAGTR